METIKELNRDSTLHLIVETINKLIKARNDNTEILNTLTSSSIGEKVSYTASDSVFVTGEIFVVKTTGQYVITTTGNGTANFAIEDALTGNITNSGTITGEYTSETLFLSEGDKIMFYASSNSGTTLKIALSMVGSFYSMVSTLQGTYNEILEQLKSISQHTQETSEKYTKLLNKAEIIMDNYTVQINALQQDNIDLSQRIATLENA